MHNDFEIMIAGDLGLPNTYIAGLMASAKKKPFIIFTEEWHPQQYLALRRFSFKRRLIAKASAVIVPGTKSREFALFLGAEPEKVFTAPNTSIPASGGDVTCMLTRNPIYKQVLNAKKQGKKIVLYLGRLLERKGPDYLLRAFAHYRRQFPNTLLVIAGEGPFLQSLFRYVHKLALKDVLLTAESADAAAKSFLFQVCDVFVVPSIYYQSIETWGLVLNEAMYFGKPVVATEAVGAAFDLIQQGLNGFIVPERDEKALADAIGAIIADPDMQNRMSVQSRQIVLQGFTWPHMLSGFHDAIQFAISGGSRMCRKLTHDPQDTIVISEASVIG
jgi:glycosyltransferase involved in cell wall biosynthesis